MDSIRGITSFVRVASAGSFSQAARQLGVSTVAVSRNVQRLESELGVRLLNRTTRKVSLTDEGRELFETSRGALAELEAAHETIAERRREPAGLVRVTSPSVFGRMYVLPLLAEFRARYPRIEVELSFADRLIDIVAEGYDVAIRAGEIAQPNAVVRKLADVPRFVCASPHYLMRHGAPQTPSQLAVHECIRYRSLTSGRPLRWEFGRGPAMKSYDVRGHLILNDVLAVCEAAIAGLGLAQLATFIATPHIRDSRLVSVLTDYAPPLLPISLYYPARRLQAARTRVFVEFVLQRLADHPDLLFDPRGLVPATAA
ncbi:MAG TPA: LysR family transcriptional regulator [Casimicrobiaceae bacterium]|nr:LysR family transcriptional regulator [Casimicrobiaceae bacterium]